MNNVALNYPIGDFLIRIKNAGLAGNKVVEVPETKFIKSVAVAMKRMGYLDKVESKDGTLTVSLAFISKEPVLLDIKLVSKPGRRVYMNVDEIESKRGPETYIVSTPEGVLSSGEVIKKRVGGEVIAKVW